MTKKEEKTVELLKYRDLVIATLDYILDNKILKITTPDYDSDEHFKTLKIQTEEHFNQGRLTKLKQWFHDLSEIFFETKDFNFNKYLQEKTNSDIDIFVSFSRRIEKIIKKGKITTDNQFYDVNIMVDELYQKIPMDNAKIALLNNLMRDYEQLKSSI